MKISLLLMLMSVFIGYSYFPVRSEAKQIASRAARLWTSAA
jgi:cbb3-type cytochrome oxidase subunit 3